MPSSKCTSVSCEDPLGLYRKQKYNSSLSSTYHANGSFSSIIWAEIQYNGFISEDTVRLGDLSIPNQVFEEFTDAYAVSILAWRTGYDGAMGLSPPWASYNGIPSLFGSLVSRGLLDQPIFSLKLPNSVSNRGDLLFGGIDPDLFLGEITTLPLVHPEYPPLSNTWAVSIESITFDTQVPLHFDMPSGSVAVLDTGWPWISLPHEIFFNVTAAVGARLFQGFVYSIPCERRQELPTMTFTLAGQNFSISAFDYTLEIDMPWLQPEPGTLCVLGLMDSDAFTVPNDTLIFSSPFLRGFYSVFDAGKREVGCKSTLGDHHRMHHVNVQPVAKPK